METLRPRPLGKITRPKGGVEWNESVTQLILEMLSHRTPPACISANIVSVAKVLLPHYDIIKEVPSVEFIRSCRGTLSYLTKLLAACELARAPVYLEQHADGTSRRQIEFYNNIIRIAIEGGFKNITLDACILTKDGTAEMQRDGILRSFQTGRLMIQRWRNLTAKLYPNRPDLLAQIPMAHELTLAKLAKGGWVMTDTCNAARLYRRLLMESIKQVAKEDGMTSEQITVWEAGAPFRYLLYLRYLPILTHSIIPIRLLATLKECLVWRRHCQARQIPEGMDG